MVKVLRSPGESFAFLDKAGNVVAIIGIHDFVYGKLNKLAARINVSVNEWFQVARTENVEKQKNRKIPNGEHGKGALY